MTSQNKNPTTGLPNLQLGSKEDAIRKVLYDSGFRFVMGQYYQAMKSGWIERHPEYLNLQYSRYWDVLWHSVIGSRNVILFNLLESEVQRESGKKYGQESFSLRHVYEKLSHHKDVLESALGIAPKILEKLGAQIKYLTTDFSEEFSKLEIDISTVREGDFIVDLLNPEYFWLSISDEFLSPKSVRDMFYSILALREHRHGYAHQDGMFLGYKGRASMQPINEEGITSASKAIFDILNFVNNKIFKMAVGKTWTAIEEWSPEYIPKEMWYDLPEWAYHSIVWTNSVKQKCTFSKYNEAIAEAASNTENYLKSVYNVPNGFVFSQKEAIQYWKNPKSSIQSEMLRKNAWEMFLLFAFQNPRVPFGEEIARASFRDLTEISYAVDDRKINLPLL